MTKPNLTKDFEIRKFQDFPKYCRVPIYIGGDQQVHIMQPFDDKEQGAGPEPHAMADKLERAEREKGK